MLIPFINSHPNLVAGTMMPWSVGYYSVINCWHLVLCWKCISM